MLHTVEGSEMDGLADFVGGFVVLRSAQIEVPQIVCRCYEESRHVGVAELLDGGFDLRDSEVGIAAEDRRERDAGDVAESLRRGYAGKARVPVGQR
ncbi:MAG: hypothetical protein V3V08_21325 [Nannocystaceae bacterium]